MKKYKDIMGRINYGVFLLTVALLPFPQIALRYAVVALGVTWLLEGRWLQGFKDSKILSPKGHDYLTKSNFQGFKDSILNSQFSILNYKLPFLLFGLWIGWRALSGLWAADHGAWSWQMERYLTFVCILPIGIWGLNEHYDWRTAGKVLAWSCVVAVPIYIVLMTTLYYHREIIDALQWKADWDYSCTDWYTFVTTNISHVKHRLFLCSVALMGAVSAVQVWREQKLKLAILLPVILSIIPLTGSRQSIISGLVLAGISILYLLPQRHRLWSGIALLVGVLLLGGGLYLLHPRTQSSDEFDAIRPTVWSVALQHPSDYLLTGVGAGQSTEYLVERYQEAGLTTYADKRIHAHNQYLEELIETGVIGLLIFLLAWISIPLCANKKGRRTAILFSTLYILNMFTDCMFGMFDGIALWAVSMLLIPLQSHAKSEQ